MNTIFDTDKRKNKDSKPKAWHAGRFMKKDSTDFICIYKAKKGKNIIKVSKKSYERMFKDKGYVLIDEHAENVPDEYESNEEPIYTPEKDEHEEYEEHDHLKDGCKLTACYKNLSFHAKSSKYRDLGTH